MTCPPAYPRLACYSRNRGGGAPLVDPLGRPNDPLIRQLARYSTVTLDMTPWYSAEGTARTDVPLLLRRYNPGIRLLGYQLVGWWYQPPTLVPASVDTTFAASWVRALRSTNGYGALNGTGAWVRWENPETEAALTSLLVGAAKSRIFDGLFLDYAGGRTFDATCALHRCVRAIRETAPGSLVLGNGWDSGILDLDGAMREGFPDWPTLDEVRNWRAFRPHKHEDWLQSGTGVTDQTTDDAKRRMRFALGTACLFDMQLSFGPDRDLSVQPPYQSWWFDEYEPAGWLGRPVGPAGQDSGNPTRWLRTFEHGWISVDTVAQDATFTRG